jgi:XTP/dITP diphosphohydrolase
MINEPIIVASNNKGKLAEIASILTDFTIVPLVKTGILKLPEETGSTLHENAFIKANAIAEAEFKVVVADDSGLFVPALGNTPGVKSARYAGENATDKDNIYKLLAELKNEKNRSAYFLCVLCLIINDKKYFFEGRLDGTIGLEEKGENGFGYDPVFIPWGHKITLAEMELGEKNKISHRKIALMKFKEFVLQRY